MFNNSLLGDAQDDSITSTNQGNILIARAIVITFPTFATYSFAKKYGPSIRI